MSDAFDSKYEVAAESFGNVVKARPSTWLLDHKKDVHSQTGEDGIIEAILSALGERDKWCVEFGAWNGQHLSNTWNLIHNSGYRAVLIEGDSSRYQDLCSTYNGNSRVVAVNAFVGFDPHNGLDSILADTSIPRDFDFCAIDIDGNDDLSPLIHPPMSRVLASFEPWWLGDATGRGAEPSM
jgi:hypothetical protein